MSLSWTVTSNLPPSLGTRLIDLIRYSIVLSRSAAKLTACDVYCQTAQYSMVICIMRISLYKYVC